MITMKDIVRDGDPILRKKVAVVETIDEQTVNELKAMREYLHHSQIEETREKYKLRPGVGLAAPQVGIDKKMTAILILDDEDEIVHDYMLINPKIKSHSVAMTYLPQGEGCLSVDEEIPGLVHRYKRIKVEAQNIEGDTIEIKASGILAIVMQHEIDHLNGVMFYDHIDKDFPMDPKLGATPYES